MKRKLKILHLEDMESDISLVGKLLKKGDIDFDRLVVETREAFTRALVTFLPDLILADHSLPSFDSHEALKIMQATGRRIPFILITANVSEEFAVDVIQRGADDYILKDRLQRLPSAIENALEKFRLEKEREIFVAELVKNERRYRALVENSADAIVILDTAGEPGYVSSSITHVLGYTETAFMKLIFYEMLHPDDRENIAGKMENLRTKPGATLGGNIFRMRNYDQNWIWIDATITNMLEDTAIRGIVVNFRAITERKMAEEQLLESEHFNKGILASLSSHIAVIDNEGTIIAVNNAWEAFATLNEAASIAAVSKGSNYLDICKQSMASGNFVAKQALEGVMSVFRHEAQTFEMEYSCDLPNEKCWFIMRVMNFGIDSDKVVISHQNISARKIAELKVAETEQKFRSLIENSVEGMAILSAEGSPLYISPSVNNVLGYTEEEAMQLNLMTLAHPADQVKLISVMTKAMAAPGVAMQGEPTRMMHKDGKWRWVEGVITNMLHDPVINGIVDNFRDVTAYVEAQEVVKASELKYRSFFENSMDGIMLTSPNGEIYSANPAACDILRMTEAEIIDAGRDRLVDATDPSLALLLEERKQTGRARGEMNFVRKDKSSFPAEISSALFKDSLGIERTSIIIRDITKRKQTEDNLATTSDALLQALNDIKKIMGASLDIICVIDGEGRFVNVSAAAARIWGYQPTELVGKKYQDFVFENDITKTNEAAAGIMEGVPVTVFENSYRHKNGSIVPMLWSATWDDNDKLMYCTAKDATDKKKMEKAMEMERQRFYELFMQAPTGIGILHGPDHIFELANPNYLELIGKRDIIGKPINEVLPEIESQDFIKLLDEVYQTGNTITSNETLVRLDRNGTGDMTDTYLDFIYQAKKNVEGIIEGIFFFLIDVTEQVQSRRKIQKSEVKYREIVKTAQEGIWLVDENNKTVFVNQKLCDILGYEEHEIMGKEIFAFMDDEGREIATHLMEEKKKGKSDQRDFKYISKKGKEVWASVSANPIFDETVFKGTLAMLSDITEKKALEQLLEKASRLARMGHFELDLELNTLYWSPITKEIHEVEQDFTPEVEQAINFYKEGASRDAITAALQQTIEHGSPMDLELEIVTARGNDRWVRVIIVGEYSNGVCIKLGGSFQDIDKIKRGEIEISKLYLERNTILESIGDAFFAVDKEWVITYWNKEAEKVLGSARQQITGKNLWRIFPELIATNIYEKYNQAVITGQSLNFEDQYGTLEKWYQISAYPSISGLSVYIRDITAQKIAELERSKMIEDIVQRNQDLEQFSYIVSHNLRAPVANIIGISNQLNRQQQSTGTGLMFTKALSASALRLDEVIMDLSNILTVKRQISEIKETVNLSRLIKEVSDSIKNVIQKENVLVITNFDSQNELITIQSYIRSIFFNLISNSIKYRQPDVPLLIEITTQQVNGKLLILFKDNGTGIDLVAKGDMIFGLYKRFHKNIEGKGIGLFMVKTQVEALGGSISIASEVNKGTQFSIEFPVTK